MSTEMPGPFSFQHEQGEQDECTQLGKIRELMLAAATRGEWLTLAEIAGPTEYGEASISAQLRHLRKPSHGGYCVEKRRRAGRETESGRDTGLWEYQVSGPYRFSPAHEGGPDAQARA